MIAAQTLSPRQIWLAATALLGLILVTSGWYAFSSWTISDMQAEFADKSRMLESLKQQPLPDPSRDGGIVSDARDSVISAPTGTIAASELQRVILKSLEDAGGTVHSVQAEITTDVFGDKLQRLKAQISFDGSMVGLQQVLFALETARPYVFIDSVLVQPAPVAMTKPGDVLRVTLAASSYWKAIDASGE